MSLEKPINMVFRIRQLLYYCRIEIKLKKQWYAIHTYHCFFTGQKF